MLKLSNLLLFQIVNGSTGDIQSPKKATVELMLSQVLTISNPDVNDVPIAIPFNRILLVDYCHEDEMNTNHGFVIYLFDSYINFYAENTDILHQWVQALKNAIGKDSETPVFRVPLLLRTGKSKWKWTFAVFDQVRICVYGDCDMFQRILTLPFSSFESCKYSNELYGKRNVMDIVYNGTKHAIFSHIYPTDIKSCFAFISKQGLSVKIFIE